MSIEFSFILLFFALTYEVYHDYPITTMYRKYKKYGVYLFYCFLLFSLYLVFKRNPSQTYDLLNVTKNVISHAPIDKHAHEMFEPIMKGVDTYDIINKLNSFGQRGHHGGDNLDINNPEQNSQTKRMLNSGVDSKKSKRSVSETKKKYVASEQNWKCQDCGQMLSAWFEVDHITPLYRGGSNHVDNLVALCRNCHGKKTAMEKLI